MPHIGVPVDGLLDDHLRAAAFSPRPLDHAHRVGPRWQRRAGHDANCVSFADGDVGRIVTGHHGAGNPQPDRRPHRVAGPERVPVHRRIRERRYGLGSPDRLGENKPHDFPYGDGTSREGHAAIENEPSGFGNRDHGRNAPSAIDRAITPITSPAAIQSAPSGTVNTCATVASATSGGIPERPTTR